MPIIVALAVLVALFFIFGVVLSAIHLLGPIGVGAICLALIVYIKWKEHSGNRQNPSREEDRGEEDRPGPQAG